MSKLLLFFISDGKIFRFVLNGIFATLIHYAVLSFGVLVLKIPYVGLANGVASIFGIITSFLGNRFFVFEKIRESIVTQFSKFFILYAVLALYHTFLLFVWSDYLKYDYKLGFILATVIQFILSFIGNKILVFKN